MSVQKVKDRFEDLQTYLGRDVTGLKKLKELKDAVNILRTSLASANEKASECESTKQTLLLRALKAESAMNDLRENTHRLKQQSDNLIRELRVATSLQSDSTGNDKSNAKACDQTLMTSIIKRVRNHISDCPEPTAIPKFKHNSSRDKQNTWAMYQRESLSRGWSHESLWLLGASVALLSAFFGEVRIETNENLSEFIKEDGEHEGFGRHLIKWLAKHHKQSLGMPDKATGSLKPVDDEILDKNTNAYVSRYGASRHEAVGL